MPADPARHPGSKPGNGRSSKRRDMSPAAAAQRHKQGERLRLDKCARRIRASLPLPGPCSLAAFKRAGWHSRERAATGSTGMGQGASDLRILFLWRRCFVSPLVYGGNYRDGEIPPPPCRKGGSEMTDRSDPDMEL